jgi:hypothetical protein
MNILGCLDIPDGRGTYLLNGIDISTAPTRTISPTCATATSGSSSRAST